MKADLDAFIDARRVRSFEYFSHDCAHIAADWVVAKTGTDPLTDLRAPGGPYAKKDLLAAARLVKAEGGLEASGTKRLGPAKHGLTARRGDIVLARVGGRAGHLSGFSFGICTGTHIVAPGNERLEFLPLTAGVAAWAV